MAGPASPIDVISAACSAAQQNAFFQNGRRTVEPDLLGIESIGLSGIPHREDLGSLLGMQHAPERWHGAVVKIWETRPDSLKPRRHIFRNFEIVFGIPAQQVPELAPFDRGPERSIPEELGSLRIRLHDRKRNKLRRSEDG